jgi:hypothetical protein
MLTSDDQTVLLVGKRRGYGAYDVGHDSDLGIVRGWRAAKLADFPRSAGVPTEISKLAGEAEIGHIDLSDSDTWDAEALADGHVLIAFLTDSTVRAFSKRDPKGRELRTDEGGKLLWEGHGADRSADLVFIVAKDRTICRYTMVDASLAQKCFAPPAAADFGEEFGNYIAVVSARRLLINNFRLIDLSESTSSYSVSRLPDETRFCGTTGRLHHYLYRLCDEEAVLIRLDTSQPKLYRLTMSAPVTAISLEVKGDATIALVANTKGELAAYRIGNSVPTGGGRSRPQSPDIVKLAEGKLDSGVRINAILQRPSEQQLSDVPIYTADSNGEVWRWQWTSSPQQPSILEQAIRVHAHRGVAVGLPSLLRNNGLEQWIASAGSDGLILLSPEAVDPLLAEAAGVFDETPVKPFAPVQPVTTPARRVDGSILTSGPAGGARIAE